MTNETQMNETYNGWSTRETWNAALWIGNDEFLYNTAKACVKFCNEDDTPYEKFVRSMNNCGGIATADGIMWSDPKINTVEMNEMMEEL